MTEPHERRESPEAPPPGKKRPPYRPTMLIFLLMPVAAAIVALLISERIGIGADNANPPAVPYTRYTLVDNPAPDFTLPTPYGGSVSLSSFQGKWLVLSFWATWCGPCREEMPLLQKLSDGEIESARALGEVAVLAVSRDEPAPLVQKYLHEASLTLPTALDQGGQIAKRYGVVGLPTTYIIDPQGVVRYKQIALFSPELLDKALTQVAEKAARRGAGG